MYDVMIYCLKAGACLAVFYLFFKLLLSRDTFHRLNRVLVMGAMVLSMILPLCVITIQRELPPMPEIEQVDFLPVVSPQPEPFDWKPLVGWLFLVGTVATLGWTLLSLGCVMRLVRRGCRQRLESGEVLVRLDEPVSPFSWGRYIVLSEADFAESGHEIILHERAHLQLRHSFDVLICDLAGCLQWFNPAMWLLRRELRAIHEYEADEAVLQSGVDARQYQLMLIKKAAGGRWYSVANSLNHSKLKTRITMMLRKKSSRWAVAKSLIVVPLVGVALGAFAQTTYVVSEDKGTQKTITINLSEGDSLSGQQGGGQQVVMPQNATIRIKGAGTSVEGKPVLLYVVDGKEVLSVKDVNPLTIKSMEVLSDSTAVALYGDKARNRVVKITTYKPGEARVVSAPASTGKMNDVVVVRYGKGAKAPENMIENLQEVQLNGDTLKTQGKVIRIRGAAATTTSGKKLVYVIDGQVMDAEAVATLKPEQIASMNVYKDKTIQEMFPGRDDIEGVLEIKTKKGQDAAAKAVEAGRAGLKSARGALESARGQMSSEEYNRAMAEIDRATTALDNADLERGKPQMRVAGTVVAVRSRGDSQVSAADVVFYLDGKKSSREQCVALGAADGIESIQMLRGKDAAAYGTEAEAKGVMLVVSKKH